MATILASAIINKAEIILQDTTNTRWPENELLGWLNDAQREIVLIKPDSYAITASVQLTSGTKQSIPAVGIRLIDITRNMGVAGTTPGRVITLIDRRIMDAQSPNWHDEAGAVVKHYMFDDRNPKTFFVTPGAQASPDHFIELVYSASPSDITADATLTLDDIYANAILDYILYRAYLKDASYTENAQRAGAALQSFMASVTGKGMVDTAVSATTKVQQPILPQQ